MTKKQVIEILKKCSKVIPGHKTGSFYTVIPLEEIDHVATEIISLYQTGQADVVIDPEKEMLDGFNMKQKNCEHEHSSVKKIDHSETTMECMDCGKILYLPERP